MMDWYQIFSYSLINGIRIFMCLALIATLLKLGKLPKSTMWLSVICGMIVAILSLSPLPQITTMAFEVIAILFILCYKCHCEFRISAFLAICFEIAVALWDFLFSTGFQILFRYSTLNGMMQKYMIPVWTVRLLMLGFAFFVATQGDKAGKILHRISSILVVAGMLWVLMLSEQSAIPLPDEQLVTWILFSVILLMAVLFYRLNRQYEMEKEIAQLKDEQTELLERDYQHLNHAYSTHAKLYHDLHNHLEALYSYIAQGEMESALNYIEDLRAPIEKIVRYVWTGDEAVDYLISSKLSAANHSGIETKVNIEFPQHTNIKSADLTTILGNLLDNALEAAVNSNGEPRFLRLTIRRINDMLIIKVENNCALEPAICDTEIKTTKEDNALHGWGLKSVWATAERYDGTLELACKNGVFCAVATLCFEAI